MQQSPQCPRNGALDTGEGDFMLIWLHCIVSYWLTVSYMIVEQLADSKQQEFVTFVDRCILLAICSCKYVQKIIIR